MSANYRNPNFLLPNELNQSINPDLSVDRHSLYSTEFDGSGKVITLPSSIDLGLNSSISYWTNFTSPNVFIGESSYGSDYHIYSNGVDTYVRIGTPLAVFSGVAPAVGQWHHIVFVRTGNSVEMYLNNVSQGVQTASFGAVTTKFDAIGAKPNGANDIVGYMDEVAGFNVSLSIDDVNSLWNNGSPGNIMALPKKPMVYYPLGEQARVGGNSNPNAGSSEWQFPNQSVQSTAVNFDTQDYIQYPYISLPGAFTVSTWAKTTDTQTYGNLLSNSNQWGGGGNLNRNFVLTRWSRTARFIAYDSSGTVIFNNDLGATGQGVNTGLSSSDPSLYNGKWNHILAIWDGTTNTGGIKVFINGVLEGLGTASTTAINTDSSVPITAGSADANFDFIGEQSNQQIWNTALTYGSASTKGDVAGGEVATIYNYGSPYTGTQPELSNLKAWYKLNAANSSYNSATSTWTFTDSAGSNDGSSTTLPISALVRSDLQFESPYSNFSLDFDSVSNEWIELTNSESLFNGLTAFSFSLWLNPSATQAAYTSPFSFRSASTQYLKLNFGATPSNNQLEINFRNTDAAIATSSINSIPLNTWTNVIIVFDASSSLSLYVNGSLDGQDTTTLPTSAVQSTNIYIGTDAGSTTGRDFNGKIDEVAIWNTALTEAQVNQVYNNGLASDLTSLSPSNWWRLGEDAYFVNNNITIPNQIAGGPSGTGSGTQTSMLVADAPGSYGSGSGVNLDIFDRIGEAPGTSPINVGNSQSYNMIPDDRHGYVPGYAPATVDNAASMSFDGTNDYFEIANDTSLQLTDKLTLSCWIYADNALGTNSIIDKFYDGVDRSYMLRLQSTTIRLSLGNASGSASVNYQSTATISNGTWYHIATTFSSVDNEVKIYINGSLDSTHSKTDLISSNNQPLRIGTGYNLLNYFDGKIDEVAIFDYALTAKQIKEDIYNASKQVGGVDKTADLNNNSNLTAPVAWYRMGD